jgi:hypothetical protein
VDKLDEKKATESINWHDAILSSGWRIKDFTAILKITTKEYYTYFNKDQYSPTYLLELFKDTLPEAMQMIGLTLNLPEKPKPKTSFESFDFLTWRAGLHTIQAKSKYFKVPEIAIQEVEFYLKNKSVIYITAENRTRIEKGLSNLRILFV